MTQELMEMTNVAQDSAITTDAGKHRGAGPSQVKTFSRLSETALVMLVLLAALVCYANTLGNGFVYDDGQQVLKNAYVKSWRYLPQIFSTTVWAFEGQGGQTNYYRPLMILTFLLLWQAFGPLPFGFHLLNVVLHGAVVVLVYFVGKTLFQDRRIGFLSAVIFAVHPIHTEAVAWIAAVGDLEATFFCLLGFWFYAKHAPEKWTDHAAVVLCFLLALLAKEPSLMLAPLLIAFEHGLRRDRNSISLGTKMRRYAPPCVAGLGYLVLRSTLFGSLAPVRQHPDLTWAQTIYSAFSLVASYTKLLLLSTGLSAFHVFRASSSLEEPGVAIGIALVAAAMLLAWVLRKRAPLITFSVFWIGVTLAPVLNARWMASNVLTERYLYLPSVGFCWLAAWCAARTWDAKPQSQWLGRSLRPILVAALSAVSLFWGIKTVARNRDWKSDLTLYTRTLETDPDAHYIRTNLGVVYYSRRRVDLAEQEWERSLALRPDSVPALTDLGMLYTKQGRYTEAAELLRRAIRLKPLWPDAHYNYGMLLDQTGQKSKALSEYKTAVDLSPLNAVARQRYANALMASGNVQAAAEQFQRSIDLDPDFEALQGLAKLYLQSGQQELAEAALRRLLVQFPYESEAHFNLGRLLEASGRGAEARKEYQAGLLTDPANAEAKAALDRIR